jgi:dihydroneopterin aldolase
MSQDKISILGIKAFGYHGVFAEEKESGQYFLADLEFTYNTKKAIKNDDLSHAINYASVAKIAKTIIEGQSRNLIEKVADDIAQELIKNLNIDWVKVTLHKPHAPLDIEFVDILVSVERKR